MSPNDSLMKRMMIQAMQLIKDKKNNSIKPLLQLLFKFVNQIVVYLQKKC